MLKRVFGALDGIEAVIYACCGAALLVGSGVWALVKLAEVEPVLSIVGAIALATAVGGAVIRDLRRRGLSSLTKFLLVAWALATFAAVVIEIIVLVQS